MRFSSRVVVVAALLGPAAGCASAKHSADTAPRSDRNVLTSEQLQGQTYQNAYEAIQALRSTWLKPRGSDSFNTPSVVVVYLDNVKLGGVETLQSLQLSTVQSIRHYDASAAHARWGVGHASGAIQVITVAPPAGGSVPPAAR